MVQKEVSQKSMTHGDFQQYVGQYTPNGLYPKLKGPLWAHAIAFFLTTLIFGLRIPSLSLSLSLFLYIYIYVYIYIYLYVEYTPNKWVWHESTSMGMLTLCDGSMPRTETVPSEGPYLQQSFEVSVTVRLMVRLCLS